MTIGDRDSTLPVPRVGHDSHVPLYVQIRTHFLELIQSGTLRPYDRMPSEAELSSTFSVSRMTARKAIDQLVADALVFRRPGKGTFVAPPPIAHRISTGQSFSAAMRALGLEHRVEVLQAGVVLPPPEVAAELLLDPDTQTVFVQRLRIVQNSPVAINSAYLEPGCRAVLDHDLTGSLKEILALIGRPVDHTRDTVEAVVASDQEALLLQIPRGAPLARVDGVGFSAPTNLFSMPMVFIAVTGFGSRSIICSARPAAEYGPDESTGSVAAPRPPPAASTHHYQSALSRQSSSDGKLFDLAATDRRDA